MLKDFIQKNMQEIDEHIEELTAELEAWQFLKEFKRSVKRPPSGESERIDGASPLTLPPVHNEKIYTREPTANIVRPEDDTVIPPLFPHSRIGEWIVEVLRLNPQKYFTPHSLIHLVNLFFPLKAGRSELSRTSIVNTILQNAVKDGSLIRICYGSYQYRSPDAALKPEFVSIGAWLKNYFSSRPGEGLRLAEITRESIALFPLKSGQPASARYRTISCHLGRLADRGYIKKGHKSKWAYVQGGEHPVAETKSVVPPSTPSDTVVKYVGLLRDIFKSYPGQPLNRNFIEEYLREECDLSHSDFNEVSMIAALTSLKAQRFIKSVSATEWMIVNLEDEK